MTKIAVALAEFDRALGAATRADAAFDALHALTRATVGVRLFTIMTVDMERMLARRAYTSDPVNYPCSGTKPVEMNRWFEVVHARREIFVANTLAEIAEVFPDHVLIGSLGCGSVVNLPIELGGQLVATMNILDREHHYAPARVSVIRADLSLPAKAALLAFEWLRARSGSWGECRRQNRGGREGQAPAQTALADRGQASLLPREQALDVGDVVGRQPRPRRA
jgi:hypothetical protein